MTAETRQVTHQPYQRRGPLTELFHTPLWILCGRLALFVGVTVGFGAISTKPKIFAGLTILFCAGMVLLGPIRAIGKVIVSVPALLFLGWWALSYLWTWNSWVYIRDTQLAFPFIASLILAVSLLPLRDITRTLVTGCQLAVIYALGWTALYPGQGTVHSDGNSGWPMSFGHKNGMGPFMLFAILTFLAFEDRKWPRRIGVTVCVALVILSQSMTTLMAGCLLLPFGLFVRALSQTPKATRGIVMAFGSLVALCGAVLATMVLPAVLGTAGKDLTLTSRTDIWENCIEVLQRQPWIGFGKGGVWILLGEEPTRSILDGLGFIVYESHNGYLEVALQLGIVGLGLYVALMVANVRGSIAIIDRRADVGWYVTMYVALIAVTSITEVTTFYQWLAFLCAFHTLVLRIARDERTTAWTS